MPISTNSDLETEIAPTGAKGVDVREYGAIPNDGIDDTAAIQRALDDGRRDANGEPLHDDFYGRPKHLYLPEGTYNVSDTIDWVGNAVTLNGDGSGKTILQLDDNAGGFGDPDKPKAVIESSDGNRAFRNNIWNLSVDTGTGNAGAIGIDYGASNQGSMENVTVTSGDGQGSVGISMADGIPGPLLLKDVKVDGFDTGIKNSGPYSATFKDIELTNQNQAGIDAGGGTLVIDGLKSTNSVPAIKSDNWYEMTTVINGDFQGGAPGVSAIESRGQIYARDINTSGYQSAIKYKDDVIAGSTVEEYASETSELFDNSAQQSLNLPVKDFPEFNDSNLDNWGAFEPRWYGDTAGLQDLMNSGKSTIYFPADRYFSSDQRVVTVPSTVKKIVGFSSIVNRNKDGENGGGIKFVVEGESADPLIVEGFGYGVTVEYQSTRDVALKNGKYQYIDGPGASDLYIENVEIGRLDLKDTENVYAWQLNTESLDEARTKVTNSGANMVVVGLKTEGKGPIIETTNGGKTEVLGGSILPVQPFTEEENQQAAFSIVDSEGSDSEGSFSIRFRHYEDPDEMYDILVEETQDGETRQLRSSDSPHEFLTLYSGNQTVGDQPAASEQPTTSEPAEPELPAPEPEPTPVEDAEPELVSEPEPEPILVADAAPEPVLVAEPEPEVPSEPEVSSELEVGSREEGLELTTTPESEPVSRPDSSSANLNLGLNLVRGRTDSVNELLVVVTDDVEGRIDGISPNEAGYTEALLEKAVVVFSTLKIGQLPGVTASRNLTFDQGSNLQFAIIENGSLDSLRQSGEGEVRLAYPFEDRRPIAANALQAGGLQLNLKVPANSTAGTANGVTNIVLQSLGGSSTIGSGVQGHSSDSEMLDFRDENGIRTVNFEVFREASYDNLVGFYTVDNEQGQIFDSFGNRMSPGDEGYTEAALNNRLTNVNLRGTNDKVERFTADIEMGQLLASFVIVDGSIEQLQDSSSGNDPEIYFTHMRGNADGVDHVRLLGDNLFGFEDLPGGGDLDYDDIVVKTTVV